MFESEQQLLSQADEDRSHGIGRGLSGQGTGIAAFVFEFFEDFFEVRKTYVIPVTGAEGHSKANNSWLKRVMRFCERRAEHKSKEGELMKAGNGLRKVFVVTSQSTKARSPGKGGFDHPSTRQKNKSALGLLQFDDLQIDGFRLGRGGQLLTCGALINKSTSNLSPVTF